MSDPKKKGTLKRKAAPVESKAVSPPQYVNELLSYTWNVEDFQIPIFTESIEGIESPSFEGGGEVVGVPMTFNVEAAVTEGQISYQVNLLSVDGHTSDRAAKLRFRVQCLVNDKVFVDLGSAEIVLNAGEAFELIEVISVEDLWDRIEGHSPNYLIQFNTTILIIGDELVAEGQANAPIPVKKIKDDAFFLNDEIESDLMLRIGDSTYATHKFMFKDVSPVIYLKTQSSSADVNVTELRLDDIDEDTALAMLLFVYTQQLPAYQTLEDIAVLIPAAEVLEMPSLLDACFNRLVELVKPDDEMTMKFIYDLSNVYGENALLQEVLDSYIQEHGTPGEKFEAWANGEDMPDGEGWDESESDEEEDEEDECDN